LKLSTFDPSLTNKQNFKNTFQPNYLTIKIYKRNEQSIKRLKKVKRI